MQTLSERKQQLALLPQTNMKGLVLLVFCYVYSIALFLVAAWITSIFITLKGSIISRLPFSSFLMGQSSEEISQKDSKNQIRANHTCGQR